MIGWPNVFGKQPQVIQPLAMAVGGGGLLCGVLEGLQKVRASLDEYLQGLPLKRALSLVVKLVPQTVGKHTLLRIL